MKDENIKEYIETLKEIVGNGGSKGTYGISYNHWKQLLDYITNLQNENMKYDQCLTELTDNYKELQKELTNLQEEIRRKDNIIYDLEDFIKEIMKATNKEIINIETAEIIYNKLKDLQGKE